MVAHWVLGLLRDGAARHGYDLMLDFKRRSGRALPSGNLYRELGRLAAHGLVIQGANSPEEDARRVPYQITEAGRQAFDRWLTSSKTVECEFEGWLAFLDRLPSEAFSRLLDRQLERLRSRAEQLAEAREDALAAGQAHEGLSVWLSLQMRRTAADVEFLHDFQARIVDVRPHRSPVDRCNVVSETREGLTHAVARQRSDAVWGLARARPLAVKIKNRR